LLVFHCKTIFHILKPPQMAPLTSPRINNLPQTVERALDILEVFTDSNEALGITELSRRVNLNKSTTYRIVQALRTRGYINQDHETNKYYLGYKILKLASGFLNQSKLREIARKYLEELSRKTLQTIQLATLEGDKVIYIDQVEGTDIFQLRLRIGNRGPLHCTAAGKSILAFLKKDELENILNDFKFIRLTDKTITSMEHLRKELKAIKRTGFAFCDREYDKYLRAIGAPIIGMGSKVIGAVVLVAPSNRIRIKEVSYFGNMVKETGLKISLEMGGRIEREVVERL
jgi:DNA-binding IclR family transcriptional regulator